MTVCKFGPCDRGARCKGYCPMHYRQQHEGRTLGPGRPTTFRTHCGHPGCGRRHEARGWCRAHYQQMRVYGYTHDIGSLHNRGRTARRCDEVAAEAEFLAGSGDVRTIAARLGYASHKHLYVTLRRAGRLDVWQKIQREA